MQQKSKAPKLRVVFDGSVKSKGHSLNDYLLVRPNLLNNLVSTIIRCCCFGKYAVSGEQISVSPKDRDALRSFLKKNSTEVFSDYYLERTTPLAMLILLLKNLLKIRKISYTH